MVVFSQKFFEVLFQNFVAITMFDPESKVREEKHRKYGCGSRKKKCDYQHIEQNKSKPIFDWSWKIEAGKGERKGRNTGVLVLWVESQEMLLVSWEHTHKKMQA